MRQKQQNLTVNEHLKHLLKAKELGLQDAMKSLEKQYQNGNSCEEVFASMSEELANVCSVFGETTVKSPFPIEQPNGIFQNMRVSVDSGESLAAAFPLENTLLHVPLKFSTKIKRRFLIDTGACASDIPESQYKESLLNDDIGKRLILISQFKTLRMACGKSLQVIGEIALKFRIHDFEFEKNFVILPTLISIILGSPFCTKTSNWNLSWWKLLKFPEIKLQVNEVNEKVTAVKSVQL